MAQPEIVVIIPAFNEERFIGTVVLKSRRYSKQVIVVDDGSKDDTARVAREAGARVMIHEHNQGKAAALNTAIQVARQLEPQVVVLVDGDGQHCAEEMYAVVDPILDGSADIAIGSRYINTGCPVPHGRMLGHRFLSCITHLVSGVNVIDSQSGFRALSPRAVEVVSLHSKGFTAEAEMQFIANKHNLVLLEVPVTINYSDPPKRAAVVQGMAVLNGIMQLTHKYRPLLFFGLPGSIALLAGMGWGVALINLYERTRTLEMGNALICGMLTIMGMLSFSTGVILHSVRKLLSDMLQGRGQ
jgi:glycosyltransferase involved in cell wall biosynthesis